MIEKLRSNLLSVRERIDAAAKRSGRSGDDITLVAVTKYLDAVQTQEVVDAGCRVLGENRPQVLWDKAAVIEQPDLSWHMIGHLQRNKVKKTVPFVSLIHSVDSNRLLNAINAAGADEDRLVSVLLEVNVSGDEAKHGYDPTQLQDALDYVALLKNVRVQGLMCMAGLGLDESATRSQFAALRDLRDRHTGSAPANVNLTELSMGMSADFEWAIEEGATIVRLGSVLLK